MRRLTIATILLALGPAGTAAAHTLHVIGPGETLMGIANRSGVSVSALAAANGIPWNSHIVIGRTLSVPAPGSGSMSAGPAAVTAPRPMGGYTVRPGDTLSGLAARSGVPVGMVAQMNGLAADARIVAGTQLKLPTGSAVLGAPAPATRAATPAAPSAPPVPTSGRLSGPQVASIAAQHGVSGSLAAAVGWQESGFNNAMVSSAGARGIMQVMPGTWTWVQQHLAAGRRLDPASAEDNVRAGALYLRQMLRETNGDPAMAAAGYYQGLASVRRIGMLPETRRYVANVLALRSRFGG